LHLSALHSLVPVREIARLAGLTERNVYATVRPRGSGASPWSGCLARSPVL
jgi:hypothetical protein